jgi:hypothetical protein
MTISGFLRKYNGKVIEDWGAYNSDESKQMCRDFNNMLKQELKSINAHVKITSGHYCFSGMIEIDNKFVYVSYDIPRGNYASIDINDASAMNGVLVRTAEHATDWTGGHNNFSSLKNVVKAIKSVYESGCYFGY